MKKKTLDVRKNQPKSRVSHKPILRPLIQVGVFPIIFLVIFVAVPVTVGAQSFLNDYIKVGFEHNDALQEQQFRLKESLYALKEAKSLFLPSISIEGSYIRSEGGRTIDFPAGDMLNPVYETLNDLTGSNRFSPTVENVSEQLNPDNFYDAKLRTQLPLVDTEIWYNRKIRKEEISVRQAELNVYKRQLVEDIKTAYYQYYQAGREVEIYESVLKLVQDNIRMNQSLYEHGRKNKTNLIRAEAERERVRASLYGALNNEKNARNYFNFLLNRPLDSEIHIDSTPFEESKIMLNESGRPVHEREELVQLESGRQMQQYRLQMERSHLIPSINAFLDLGSQAVDWTFDDDSRYYMVGINFRWNLFGSGRYRHQQQQTKAAIQATNAKISQTESVLDLERERAFNAYHTAMAHYQSAKKQLYSAEEYYEDQQKRYAEGNLLYIELLDAQNALTEARLREAVSFADVQTALAQIERSTASYPIHQHP